MSFYLIFIAAGLEFTSPWKMWKTFLSVRERDWMLIYYLLLMIFFWGNKKFIINFYERFNSKLVKKRWAIEDPFFLVYNFGRRVISLKFGRPGGAVRVWNWKKQKAERKSLFFSFEMLCNLNKLKNTIKSSNNSMYIYR